MQEMQGPIKKQEAFVERFGVSGLISDAQILRDNPRSDASITITMGGTITNGNSLTVNVNDFRLPGGTVQFVIPVVTADDLASVAAKLAKALAESPVLRDLGAYASHVAAVVTLKMPGPLSNFATLSRTLSGGATLTAALGNSGSLAGGAGPVIPLDDFDVCVGGMSLFFVAGQPKSVSKAALLAIQASKARAI